MQGTKRAPTLTSVAEEGPTESQDEERTVSVVRGERRDELRCHALIQLKLAWTKSAGANEQVRRQAACIEPVLASTHTGLVAITLPVNCLFLTSSKIIAHAIAAKDEDDEVSRTSHGVCKCKDPRATQGRDVPAASIQLAHGRFCRPNPRSGE